MGCELLPENSLKFKSGELHHGNRKFQETKAEEGAGFGGLSSLWYDLSVEGQHGLSLF